MLLFCAMSGPHPCSSVLMVTSLPPRKPCRSKGRRARLIPAEMIGEDEVRCAPCLLFMFVMSVGLYYGAARGHLFCCQAEEEVIVCAYLFAISTVAPSSVSRVSA